MSTEPQTKGTRIKFPDDDAAKFARRLEDWRRSVASRKLKGIGYRVASILPEYLNRSFGYCFPKDIDLATKLNTSVRNVGKGMVVLEDAGLIERETVFRKATDQRAGGKNRRIHLTLPTTPSVADNERNENERNTPVNERNKSANERNENERNERNNGVGISSDGITPDVLTPDNKIRSGEKRLASTRERKVKGQFRPNPYPSPSSWGDDVDFLSAFDRFVTELMGDGEVGAGELERITREAFDNATDSDDLFMPFHWSDICALRTGSTAEWFRFRASSLVHRRAAA